MEQTTPTHGRLPAILAFLGYVFAVSASTLLVATLGVPEALNIVVFLGAAVVLSPVLISLLRRFTPESPPSL